jgi:hypothetical protein
MAGAGVQPAQIGLQPQHDAFDEQCSRRAVRLGQRGALRVGQPAQQLAALASMTSIGSASRAAAAAAISLRWKSVGLAQLTSASHAWTRWCPAAVSAYTFRSGRSTWPTNSAVTSSAFSRRVRVT